MPKLVDHDRYRTEIVAGAAPIFSAHGFHGLGMREIAERLGMSKSALYHYFPSKESLFAACTRYVVGRDEELALMTGANHKTPREASRALMTIFREIEKNFQNEMYLLMDYIRNKAPRDVARDANMKHANARYRSMIAHHVGEDQSSKVLVLLIGGLTQRLLDGGTTSHDDIEKLLHEVLLQSQRNR